MARTALERTLAAAYGCWCALAVLGLLNGAVTRAATVGGGVAGQRFSGGVPPEATRHKRWSTTFGGNTSNKNSSANSGVRDCVTDSDCLDTPNTSCGMEFGDRKRRCLCADGKPPLNGDCVKKPRGPLFVPALKTSCESDVECLPNAICKNNATSTNSRLKICMCKEGFTEEKEACSYGDLLTFSYTILLIGVFTSWIWNDRCI